MLASVSLHADKLFATILEASGLPQRIAEEGLDWPYRMALQMVSETLCHIGPRFADWERVAWHRSFDAFDKLLANQEMILQAARRSP